MKSKINNCSFILLIILIISSCNKGHSKKEIESAMKQYDHLIQKLDADSISLMFTPDGDLGDAAHGRSWIKRYLSTFKNVKVLSQNSTSDSIRITGDSSIQKGTYTQVVILSPGDTAKLKGNYIARWVWSRGTGWLLRSINTRPEAKD